MEGSLVAYKVFTNGSTLQASELNENLMQQATAVFSNAAARTAAITSPVEGQLTYLEDTNRYAMWSGSSWISPFGLTPIISQTIGTGVSTVTVNNVFTTEFDAYKIILTDSVQSANSNNLFLKLNNSAGSTYYSLQTYYTYSTGTSVNQNASGTSNGFFMALTHTTTMSMEAELFAPALAKATTYRASNSSVGFPTISIGIDSNAVAHSGFTLSLGAGTTITGGQIRVYGYKKD
jgi:hypothetical protein